MQKIFVLIVLSVLFNSCQKDLDAPTPPPPPPSGILPTVTTSAVSSITTTSAISGGNVSADGGSAVTERGVCWSTTTNPVITGNHSVDGSGTGIFTSNINGLSPNTTYYLRAYAKNTQGVAYGNEIVFQTTLTPPPLPPGDVASLFFITGLTTTSRSFITYNAAKTKLWEIPNFLSIVFWSTPAYNSGNIYLPSQQYLLSLNANTGSLNWQYTDLASVVNPQLSNDTIVTASSLIAPAASNAILFLNKNTGSVIWSKTVTDQPVISPVMSDGKVFVLTVNSTGTALKLSAYDVITKNLVWQNPLVTAFFTAAPPEMIVRHDSLIVFTSSNQVHSINKNTGALHWSKTLGGSITPNLYKNDLAYYDNSTKQVKLISLQTGNIILQSNPVAYTSPLDVLSYVYNDAFYHLISDSVYCTSLTDGSLRWRKKYETSLTGAFFKKLTVVGNTVYGGRKYDNANDEFKLMMLNAIDFTAKDSILVPKREMNNFSILSVAGIVY
jgi:outer membrane protein assembly factor BamB